MTIEIKICGITTLEDARAAAESGADAIGFIFHRPSPRYVSPDSVESIIERLSIDVATVGVFVNADATAVIDTMTRCHLDLIQLHGSESPEYCRRFPSSRIIKAVAPRADYDPAELDRYDVQAFLVDTYDPKHYGGTGRHANWKAASIIARSYPLILAGGLTAENLPEAIASVSPHAVDINSGVERAPGKKDQVKIKNIIRKVRKYGTAGDGRRIFCRHTTTNGEHNEATIT
ncbi:MAG: phosphoribosylanthranilate isomerase [Deltaproteobacteria bacterium]|nr:phosphoribosylanthranilate isomerase [Deltaproteobacteria bacterium]MBN2688317.1 phosphoribosylanthranilate isomerase [Deltaproteobacteria bacterium]